MANPLHQFEIHPLVSLPLVGGYDLSFTNASLFMMGAVLVTFLFMMLPFRHRHEVPTRFQALAELYYRFVADLAKDTAGSDARPFFPFIFSIFSFVLLGNILGLLPFSFTFTSHIIVTFVMAIFIFVMVTVVGFVRHGTHFFALFVPEGLPDHPLSKILLVPLIFIIEFFSYLIRPITLSVRLGANMMAGHIMLKLIVGFVGVAGLWGIAPFLLSFAIIGFEFFVAVLQAYIFTLMTCVYLKDALYLH
jgi:F-type H+-transporting ATPase subunit a